MTPKRSVLVISTNSDLAGAPIHVRDLVLALKKYYKFVVLFGETGPVAEVLRENGVKTIIITSLRSRLSARGDIVSFFLILSCIIKYKPNIIHLHSSKAGMLGRICGTLTFTPWIYTVHGWSWRGFNKYLEKLFVLIERACAFLPGDYIYVANSVKKDAQEILHIPKTRGRVIYNAVCDQGFEDEPDASLNILMIGRVSTAKDHASLIAAFESVPFQSKLTLCGSGTNHKAFINMAAALAPSRFRDILFLGPQTNIKKLLTACNIFCLISNFEAFPLTILEAMSAKRAVIATDTGGISEIIRDGENGILVPQKSPESIANAIITLSDLAFRKRLANAGRLDYESKYTPNMMVSRVRQVYDKLIPP